MSDLPETYVQGFHCEESVRKLRYGPFVGGRSVSNISLGASALAGIYDSDIDKEKAYSVIRNAIRHGINLVDVAPWYGHGVGEKELGIALQGVPRNAYYLTTKVGRYEASRIKQFDFTREKTINSVLESLRRLQVDYIDGIQVHDPEFSPSLDIILKETIPALLELKQKGLVKWIGITGYPLQVLRDLAENHRELEIESCLSYARNNLHDTSLISSGLLSDFHEKGMSVINGSPLSMGLLTSRNAPQWHPASKELRDISVKAAKFCHVSEVSFERIALYFSLCLTGNANSDWGVNTLHGQPGVSTTMFSTIHQEQLEEALELASKDFRLSESEQKVLVALRSPNFFGGLPQDVFSWENVEVQRYFAAIGKLLLGEWYKTRGENGNTLSSEVGHVNPPDNHDAEMTASAIEFLNAANRG